MSCTAPRATTSVVRRRRRRSPPASWGEPLRHGASPDLTTADPLRAMERRPRSARAFSQTGVRAAGCRGESGFRSSDHERGLGMPTRHLRERGAVATELCSWRRRGAPVAKPRTVGARAGHSRTSTVHARHRRYVRAMMTSWKPRPGQDRPTRRAAMKFSPAFSGHRSPHRSAWRQPSKVESISRRCDRDAALRRSGQSEAVSGRLRRPGSTLAGRIARSTPTHTKRTVTGSRGLANLRFTGSSRPRLRLRRIESGLGPGSRFQGRTRSVVGTRRTSDTCCEAAGRSPPSPSGP